MSYPPIVEQTNIFQARPTSQKCFVAAGRRLYTHPGQRIVTHGFLILIASLSLVKTPEIWGTIAVVAWTGLLCFNKIWRVKCQR
jgi:hypothetical protein